MGRWTLVGTIAMVLGWALLAGAALPPASEYAGSESCARCHPERYEGWRRTYHSSVVAYPEDNPSALQGDFTQEGVGFDPASVEFAVGGHWYQRYATRVGGELYVFPRMWSTASHRWESVDTWSWKRKPYNTYCVGCHATRYDPESQTYLEHRVGCETCHGPGRRHVESGGTATIVDPGNWDLDEQDLLCASCHVRGADPSGQYMFATDYVPGERVEDHYVPFRVRDGETIRGALLRQFREWQARLGEGPPASCDVCGIGEDREPRRPRSVTDYCLRCHEYGEDYTAHTRHPGSLELECLDCHRRVELSAGEGADIHTLGYFQVHARTSYEPAVADACQDCHADKPAQELDRHLAAWDHSSHLPAE